MSRIVDAAALAVALTAGVGIASTLHAAEPRFPEHEAIYSAMPGYRTVARAAARIYVKVTIRTRKPLQTGRTVMARRRIVSGASGIIVDASGYIVTAAHIARSRDLEARVQTLEGREYPARVVRVDAEHDVALLRVTTDGIRFPTAEPASTIIRNQPVLAIGTPDNEPGVVSVGRVVEPRMRKRVRYGDYGFADPMLLNMRIAPGHSGGPVVDSRGRLVGMIVGFDLRLNVDGEYVSTGAAYAVPVEDLNRLVRRWTGPADNG